MRSFRIDKGITDVVDNINAIIEDEDIDMVVEVMGGCGIVKTVVLESLKCGKSVVSANKVLIAECVDEIKNAVSAGEGKAIFAYEAAVCGGIPIIQSLQRCVSDDIVHEVMGICNGTTNDMLGKMELGADYAEVLKEAQDLGFAEADPADDVEGYDVRAKISIFTKVVFGTTVPVESIPCKGITDVSSVDFGYAKLLGEGCTIKFIGTATRLSEYGEHEGAISVYVAPVIVPLNDLLASARGADNAVAVKSSNLGVKLYTGPRTGRFPTANSVVADIFRVASGNASSDPFPLTSKIGINNDYSSEFYIRISFQDELGIIKRVGEIAEESGMSSDCMSRDGSNSIVL